VIRIRKSLSEGVTLAPRPEYSEGARQESQKGRPGKHPEAACLALSRKCGKTT